MINCQSYEGIKQAKNFFKKLDNIIKNNREISSLNIRKLNLIFYLGELERGAEELKGLYPNSKQERLLETSTKKMCEEFNLNKVQVNSIRNQLKNQGLIERVEHDYYKGRVFVGLTEKGKQIYESIIECI